MLGDLPIAALTITDYPSHIGDLPGDFTRTSDFEKSTNLSSKAHTQVGIGLLGFKFPSTPKSASDGDKYYGLTIADVPVAAIVLKNTPKITGDLQAEFHNPDHLEDAVKSIPAHTSIAIGLLGVRIPLRK